MDKREILIEQWPDEELLFMDGFDSAILGLEEESMRVIYSRSRCIACLMENDGMDEEEAIEFFDYNSVRANSYMGDRRVVICDDTLLCDDDLYRRETGNE